MSLLLLLLWLLLLLVLFKFHKTPEQFGVMNLNQINCKNIWLKLWQSNHRKNISKSRFMFGCRCCCCNTLHLSMSRSIRKVCMWILSLWWWCVWSIGFHSVSAFHVLQCKQYSLRWILQTHTCIPTHEVHWSTGKLLIPFETKKNWGTSFECRFVTSHHFSLGAWHQLKNSKQQIECRRGCRESGTQMRVKWKCNSK